MNAAVKRLTDEARKLSPEERIELIDEVLSTLGGSDPVIERAWAAEAKDRLEAYRRGEIRSLDFGEVMRKYDRA